MRARAARTPRAGWSATASTTPRAWTASAACPPSRTGRGPAAPPRPPTSACVSVRGCRGRRTPQTRAGRGAAPGWARRGRGGPPSSPPKRLPQTKSPTVEGGVAGGLGRSLNSCLCVHCSDRPQPLMKARPAQVAGGAGLAHAAPPAGPQAALSCPGPRATRLRPHAGDGGAVMPSPGTRGGVWGGRQDPPPSSPPGVPSCPNSHCPKALAELSREPSGWLRPPRVQLASPGTGPGWPGRCWQGRLHVQALLIAWPLGPLSSWA